MKFLSYTAFEIVRLLLIRYIMKYLNNNLYHNDAQWDHFKMGFTGYDLDRD